MAFVVPGDGDGPRNHPAIAHLTLGPLGNAVRSAVIATRSLLFATMHQGKQYIVFAIGGQQQPAEFIAVALP